MARIATYGIVEFHPVSHLFPMHAFGASEGGNKRLTGNQKKEKERLTDEAEY
ncbi:hypothetical protein NN761_01975 [Bacteroides clarus]|uniref:hypothetical protein n=1 Tax=Bacteroides TaxID=816 RepID=UPI002100DF05|nr:hypothetical protein [Bacteroides clarus]MCQ1544347.1 hypothetical protein [Bacteroides clarus]